MGEKQTALKNLSKIKKRTGRPKGSKDKFTNLKQAFLQAFDGIGGSTALQNWAEDPKNRRDFYQMITKLFPKDIKVGPDEEGKDALTELFESIEGITRGLPNRSQEPIRE
jgi:hypothetical protein